MMNLKRLVRLHVMLSSMDPLFIYLNTTRPRLEFRVVPGNFSTKVRSTHPLRGRLLSVLPKQGTTSTSMNTPSSFAELEVSPQEAWLVFEVL